MARNKSRFPSLVFTFVLIFLAVSSSIHSPRGKRSRVRRQACEEYTYEGRTCCKCGAGFKLKEHCSARKDDQKCEPCEDKTYNPVPSSLKNCEPCERCSQLANLEVAVHCSSTNDTLCKCKDHHYCISDTHPCTVCSPCKVCDPGVGVKVECSLTSDTICNEPQGINVLSVALGISIPLVIAIAIAIAGGVIYWRKRKAADRNQNSAPQGNGVRHDEIMLEPLIGNVDLMPHIPEIASEIGWQLMRNIAMSNNMKNGKIESIQEDNPRDTQERTLQLLKAWVEMEGRGASVKLIQYLRNSHENLKAENVEEILRRSASSPVQVANIG